MTFIRTARTTPEFVLRIRRASALLSVVSISTSACMLPAAPPERAKAPVVTVSTTGFGGIDIGDSYADIARSLSDFPAQSAGIEDSHTIVITYGEADYVVNEEGSISEIRPHNPRTSAGLTTGDTLDQAIGLYGEPRPDDSVGSYIFTADTATGTAWRVAANSGDEITAIALCDCLYGSDPSSPGTTISGETTVIASRPYLPDGTLDPDFGTATRDIHHYGCLPDGEPMVCGTGSTGYTLYFCSISNSQQVTCPSGEPGNTFLVSPNLIVYPGNQAGSLPELGPSPYRVTLSDGQTCTFGHTENSFRYTNIQVYWCDDGEILHFRPDFEPAFDITGGTWTAQKGPLNGLDVSTVSVTLAEVYIVE